MARRPVVLIHGYSDTARGFQRWREILRDSGYDDDLIRCCSYVSLNNEVTIHDIAEGFDRALREEAGIGPDDEFDAITHSTGMLVLRAWLTLYERRQGRVKHLIGLAPASWGSPLAHLGRSFIGAMFKGDKNLLAPDFLQAGDQVLDALELGSKFTWDLAHRDLLGERPFYGTDDTTPYVFIFCGDAAYNGPRQLVNKPGTDGTVRWAGTALNTRKITIDLTINPDLPARTAAERVTVAPWSNYDIRLYPIAGLNHGTIHEVPSAPLIQLVVRALTVSSEPGSLSLADWEREALAQTAATQQQLLEKSAFQQFVVHAVDERGDGITDYNLQLYRTTNDGEARHSEIDADPHAYSTDPSYRCFHINVKDLLTLQEADYAQLVLRVIASSGTQAVGYRGFTDGKPQEGEPFEAEISLANFYVTQREQQPGGDAAPIGLFSPFTTTLMELKLTREALPFDRFPNNVCSFPDLRHEAPAGSATDAPGQGVLSRVEHGIQGLLRHL